MLNPISTQFYYSVLYSVHCLRRMLGYSAVPNPFYRSSSPDIDIQSCLTAIRPVIALCSRSREQAQV